MEYIYIYISIYIYLYILFNLARRVYIVGFHSDLGNRGHFNANCYRTSHEIQNN